ncbi:hypothetical protein [Saccharospirillum impatiens]|uniref:hypothetical protein n=1 Tax=Saccharospirillum impatiens TaxID=169438 RepID=UPI000409B79E|nr:hypothetical protein [Saccharospirillum impatiens]
MKTNWRYGLSPCIIRGLFWTVFLIITVLSLLPLGHPEFSPNDKVNHLIGWGALGALGCLGWSARLRLVVMLWFASFTLEGAQGLTTYRMFSLADAVANGAGLLIGLGLVSLWDRLKHRLHPTH